MAYLDDMETFNYVECKEKYFEKIITENSQNPNKKKKYYPFNDEDKNEIISFVKKKRNPYHLKFDIIKDSSNVELLIMKRRVTDMPVVEVLPASKCFDIMVEVHLLEQHAPGDKMEAILKNIYHIPLSIIKLFIKSCSYCCARNLGLKNSISFNAKPYCIPEFTVLCTISQISQLHSNPDNGFSHLIIYVDTLTNYIVLRPTYTKYLHVIAYELLRIFLDFGLPENIYVSDNNLYYKTIIDILKSTNVFALLPKVLCIKNLNNDVKIHWASNTIAMLTQLWIRRNTSNWAIGVKDVQWHLNNSSSSIHPLKSRKLNIDVIKSPYHAHFGFLPNSKVIQRTNKLSRTGNSDIAENNMKTFELNCLNCGEKIYEIFFKTCVICKRKCHFNCCVMNVVESSYSTFYNRNLEAICHPCVAEKKKYKTDFKVQSTKIFF